MQTKRLILALFTLLALGGCELSDPGTFNDSERADESKVLLEKNGVSDFITKTICEYENCDLGIYHDLGWKDEHQYRGTVALRLTVRGPDGWLVYDDKALRIWDEKKDYDFADGTYDYDPGTAWTEERFAVPRGEYFIETRLGEDFASLQVTTKVEVAESHYDDWLFVGDDCEFSTCGGNTVCKKSATADWTCRSACTIDAQCKYSSCETEPRPSETETYCTFGWEQ